MITKIASCDHCGIDSGLRLSSTSNTIVIDALLTTLNWHADGELHLCPEHKALYLGQLEQRK